MKEAKRVSEGQNGSANETETGSTRTGLDLNIQLVYRKVEN